MLLVGIIIIITIYSKISVCRITNFLRQQNSPLKTTSPPPN